ncbi:NAD(P)H-dependent oxidoreductase [Streptomyces sp. NPDC051219]|uniref:NADPH-dependent FMN reductase n=1 Tax=Streptomyces sp. NPDC051219 TaxID=3155283 RepID=UPI003446EA6B
MAHPVLVVGMGGSLRTPSTSLAALRVAIEGAAAAGADTEVIALSRLDLPFYAAEHGAPPAARFLAETIHGADALLWSSPTYHGSVSGAFKNAVDWLALLADRDPPYLSNKPVGMMSTVGGVQGLQAISAMEFIVRALRGWSVPLVLAVPWSTQVFDAEGNLNDPVVAEQLHGLGAEVTRAALQFRAQGTCDYAEGRLHGSVLGGT